MQVELKREQMTAAIERAKSQKSHVRALGWRVYAVTTGEGHRYVVRFNVVDGRRFASCTCPARVTCKHIAAAAQAHIVVAGMRAQGERINQTRSAAIAA